MMNDILDRLFYGEVSPYDDSVEDMETFRELNSKMAEVWSRIDALASPELKELLGHRPLEVLAGALLGIIVAVAFAIAA